MTVATQVKVPDIGDFAITYERNSRSNKTGDMVSPSEVKTLRK